MLKVKHFDEKEFVMKKVAGDIKEAREDVQKGNIYTQKQLMIEFSLFRCGHKGQKALLTYS